MFWFSQMLKTEKKVPFFTKNEFVFFFNWEILVKKFVDFYSENPWKHVVSSIVVTLSKAARGQSAIEIATRPAWKTTHLMATNNGCLTVTHEFFIVVHKWAIHHMFARKTSSEFSTNWNFFLNDQHFLLGLISIGFTKR